MTTRSTSQRPSEEGNFIRYRRAFGRLARAVVVTYLLVLLVLTLFERYLVYPGAGMRGGDWNADLYACEDIYFQSADGTKLHGWYREHPDARLAVLVCHGNGENVALMAPYIEWLSEEHAVSVFAFDYRGYGQSEGRPDEAGVLEDGSAAQQWLAKRVGVSVDEVAVLGRSIGGGVAVDLAARHGARALVLERTFTSLHDTAARLYWWAPVRLLMRNRYDSLSKIGDYRGPLLQSHGTHDEIVPFDLGEKLFAAAHAESKQFVRMPEVGHNGPPTDEYLRELRRFLLEVSQR